jgi:hypothetical protein
MLWMSLAFLIAQHQLFLTPTSEPVLIQIEAMMDQYELQVAARDTLAAMNTLDSLNGATLLKMGGYDFTWNPQAQTLEFFDANGTLVEEAVSGIDGAGRQSFAIPVGENATICGWVDVDIVNNRIVVAMGSEEAIIELVTDGTTNAVLPGPVFRRSCVCLSSGTRIAGCGFSWCNPPRSCRGSHNSGTCEFINVTDPVIAPAPN